MSRHIFSVLSFLLLLLGCACGPAHAADGAPVPSVPLFETGRTIVPEKMGDEVPTTSVSSFDSPFLAAGSGVMVAFAEAWHTESDKEAVDIVARYIEVEGAKWVDVTENNGNNWRTQLVLQKKAGVNHSVLRRPTAAIKDNKIYLLALHNQMNGWHFELAVGAISGEAGSKKIEWNTSKSLHTKLTEKLKNKALTVFPGSNNSAFLASNGKILFSANSTNKEGKWGYAIMQLKTDEEQWEVSFVENPAECRHFSLFEWKEKLITIFSGCLSGNNYVKEYDEVKKGWKDADDTHFHVWSSKHTPRDVISVTIGNKNALLFTDECSSFGSADDKCKVSLWLSDGSRVHDAGWIKTLYANVTSGGLLYTNGKLFFMYQDTDKGSEKIVLQPLNEELGNIRFLLNTWAEKDELLSRPCSETAPKGASPDTLCVTPMPTNGLVGFLSNDSDVPNWLDEYHFMNATIKRGTEVKNGYTFSGYRSGAQWSVGYWTFRRWYNFAKYGATVLATVTVHEIPEGDAPLLTVDGDGVYERLGLWYKNKQWKVVSNDDKEEPAVELETQKEYRVALILQNNTISAYVNGKSLGSLLPISTPGEELFDIKSVYIGRYGRGSEIHMTVTNVLLYNRALNGTELEATSRTILTAKTAVSVKSSGQAEGKATVKAPGQAEEKAPGQGEKKAPGQAEEKAPGQAEEKAPGQAEEKAPGQAEEKAPGQAEEKAPGQAEEKAPGQAEEKAPGQAEAKAPGQAEEKAPGQAEEKAPGQGEEKVNETPTDEREDSSVCVRVGFTSLFLLGCFCLAIF